jgi:hypothetical protein
MRPSRLRGLALVLFLLGAHDCRACHKAPDALLIGVDELIGSSTDVSVAKVVRAIPRDYGVTTYEFVVKRRLAGWNQESFTMIGADDVRMHKDTSFDHHQAAAFWERGGGRLINGADCAIHPTFVVGENYLVFRDRPLTWRSAEKIETVDEQLDLQDKWLRYVEAKLRGVKPQ